MRKEPDSKCEGSVNVLCLYHIQSQLELYILRKGQ